MQKEQMLQLLNDGLKDIAKNMEAIQKSFWRMEHAQYLDFLSDDDVQIIVCCEPTKKNSRKDL